MHNPIKPRGGGPRPLDVALGGLHMTYLLQRVSHATPAPVRATEVLRPAYVLEIRQYFERIQHLSARVYRGCFRKNVLRGEGSLGLLVLHAAGHATECASFR